MSAPQWMSPLSGALAFAALWIAVTWLLSHTSGWVRLAQRYRADREAQGIPVRVRAARMGRGPLGRYRNVLTLWVSADGLHLRLLFWLRINSPDLFFPWSEVTVTRGRYLFFDYVELTFQQAPQIPLRIYGQSAEHLREAAGTDWPAEKSPPV
jgi:hypothetical protein